MQERKIASLTAIVTACLLGACAQDDVALPPLASSSNSSEGVTSGAPGAPSLTGPGGATGSAGDTVSVGPATPGGNTTSNVSSNAGVSPGDTTIGGESEGSIAPTSPSLVSDSTAEPTETRLDDTSGASTGSNASTEENTRPQRPTRVLLYHFSTLDIPSVPQQLTALTTQLASRGYDVDTSEDPAVFSDENLTKYAAVGMINTCFSPFGANNDGATEGQVLQRFLQDGGGLFGTHCADVTFQSANPPALYNQLLGGRASSSNFDGTSQCRKVAEHPTTAGLPETFSYEGNLDGTNFIADDSEVLVRCTWDNGNGQEVAVSWVRNEGPGRVFFSNFAKVDQDLSDSTIGEPHLIAGLFWVLGL
jgi:type 1 glutamine amidotransferase